MPDHNREAHPLHTLGKSVGEDGVVRCPNCPGLTRVTFQAECMCCGREVAQSQDSGTDDITDSVQALSIGSEVPETPVPLPACRAFVGEFRHLLSLQPVQVHIPEDRRNNVAVPRNLNSIFNRYNCIIFTAMFGM
uniref:Uncharacterized protein n=1 Tax=Physcomitrium patens TaxID=3218 RepID=A0A7I3ZHN1_PHYPA